MRNVVALCLSLCLAAVLALSPVAAQQQGSLVGAWSYSGPLNAQGGSLSMFFQFGQDGSFRLRVIFPSGQSDYMGQYQVNGNSLQLLYRDYEPKQSCRYGACYPIPPMVQMGQVYNQQIEFQGPTRFVFVDGGGAKLFVRAQ